VKGEVVEADEAGLIDNRTRDGGHAGHGGKRGGEQAEGNAATAEVAVRVVGGWDVGDDAAEEEGLRGPNETEGGRVAGFVVGDEVEAVGGGPAS
jgi:hypothetical protein